MLEDNFTYELPALPYAEDALEPYIDAETMKIHRTKHHQAYLDNLKKIENVDLKKPIQELLLADARPAVQNQGGGFYNHCLFWKMMTPKARKEPKTELKRAIEKKWTSFDKFQEEFAKAAQTQFGSGWAWLVKKKDQSLEIVQRPNQNHPPLLKEGSIALLGVDVWEHAYYLKYKSARPDYVKAWWNVVNWDFVEHRFTDILKS